MQIRKEEYVLGLQVQMRDVESVQARQPAGDLAQQAVQSGERDLASVLPPELRGISLGEGKIQEQCTLAKVEPVEVEQKGSGFGDVLHDVHLADQIRQVIRVAEMDKFHRHGHFRIFSPRLED